MRRLLRLCRVSARRRRREGTAALVALASILPLVVVGGTLLGVVVHGRSATEATIARRAASDAAASGGQDALAKLQADPNYTGAYDLDLGTGLVHITVTAWAHDGVDNDGVGGIDDAGEANLVGIRAEGAVNEMTDANGNLLDLPTRTFHSVAEAIVRKQIVNVTVNQSVYIDDPLADINFNGNAFLISGNDTNLNGTAGPKPAIAGIGVPGSTANIKSQIAKNQKADVVGSGGTPSVGTVADTDFITTMDGFASAATIVFNGPSDDYSGTLGDRATMTAKITHAKGNFKLHGNTSGCGILIVDGDLEVVGTFDYAGLIFVKGAVVFKGGGGNKDLHGALMTLGAVAGEDFEINGSVQLRYSSEALTSVTTQLSNTFTLVSWRQR